MAAGITSCWPCWLQCHPALTGKELVGKYQRQTWPQREQSKTFTTVLVLLLFSTSIKKPQPLLETPHAIQTPVPSSDHPPAEPPSSAPCPVPGQHICCPPARPWRQTGICFSLSQPTSGWVAEGQSRRGVVPLLSRRSDRVSSLVLHQNPLRCWCC